MRIGIYQSYWGTIGGGQAYMGAAAEALAARHEVEIVHHYDNFDRTRIEEALDLDLSRVRFRLVPRQTRPDVATWNPVRRLRAERSWCAAYSAPYDLFVNCSSTPPLFCHAPRGAAVVFFPETSREEFQGRASPGWATMPTLKKGAYRIYQSVEWQCRFRGYQTFVSISEYSRHWLESRWGRRSTIVYPPLRPGLKPATKEKLLLSVGRFHLSQHKKAEDMIEAFKALCDEGLQGWQYVLVGPIEDDVEHRAYLDRLKAAVHGYPVVFRTNISAQELRGLLASASVFWHSMGYGVDAQKAPDRLEHFGMVATEAMATGCVPVLFRGGGLREIVQDGHNGFLWTTLDELKAHTRRVMSDASLRTQLAASAVRRSEQFSKQGFEKRWLDALAPALN
jgi:glycosyltransferase involved in cell wall biosynthesis